MTHREKSQTSRKKVLDSCRYNGIIRVWRRGRHERKEEPEMSTFNRLWDSEFELLRSIGRGENIIIIRDAEEGPHIVAGDVDSILPDLLDYFGPTRTWGKRGVSLTPASELDLRTFLAECEEVMEQGTIEAADTIDDLMDRRTAARLRAGVA